VAANHRRALIGAECSCALTTQRAYTDIGFHTTGAAFPKSLSVSSQQAEPYVALVVVGNPDPDDNHPEEHHCPEYLPD